MHLLSRWQTDRKCGCWPNWRICPSCSVLLCELLHLLWPLCCWHGTRRMCIIIMSSKAITRWVLPTGAVLDRIFIFVVSNPSIYTNMAAANCVVITNGGELLEQPISTNSVPRAFFLRVAIGCRLLGGVLIGGYMRWFSVNRRYGI